MARVRLTPGTVFAFPIAPELYGAGQVVRITPLLLSAIFQPTWSEPFPAPETIASSPIALVVTTFDVLIKRGDWLVVGQAPVVELPELVFRVSRSTIDKVVLENYDRTVQRPATPDEIRIVPLRSSISPKGVEQMFAALHGHAERSADFEDYTWEAIVRRAELLTV